MHKVLNIVKVAEAKYGHKIYVIQDAAHSFGSKWQGQTITPLGDATFFALNIGKIINSVFGGVVLMNDEENYRKLCDYRKKHFKEMSFLKSLKRGIYLIMTVFAFNSMVYSIVNWLERKGLINRFVRYYDEYMIDMPSDWLDHPTALEARIGLIQLSKYDEIIEKRRQTSRTYIETLRANDHAKTLPYDEDCTYSHFVALVDDREQYVQKYLAKGIQLGIFIEYAIPLMQAYQAYTTREYPIAKYYSKHVINFPNWPGVRNVEFLIGE